MASYSVSPALPAGLTLNTSTGVITGTPTAVTATATYTVTASNSAGSTTATLSITVNDAAPAGLAYTAGTAVYTVGTPIPPNSPTSTGGAVTAYSVSPDLPAGLSLDDDTGIISGTPTAVTATASYTVTASNVTGSSHGDPDHHGECRGRGRPVHPQYEPMDYAAGALRVPSSNRWSPLG